MAAWPELKTDALWDPWIVAPIFATLAGWPADPAKGATATPIEATTIDDPAAYAARWRNLGGGGAGWWLAADGSSIGAARDDGWHFDKPIIATSASFSGNVTIAGTLGVGGHLTGSTASFSGNVAVGGTLGVTGATTLSSTLAVTGNTTVGGTLGVTGHLTGSTASFSGAVNVGSLVSAGTISGTGGSFSGNVTVGGTLGVTGATTLAAVTASGAALFTGTLTAESNTFLGNSNTDGQTSIGVWTHRNAAATATQFYADAANNRVIIGGSAPLSSAPDDLFTVRGKQYIAPATASDVALALRNNTSATSGFTLGVTSTPSLSFKDPTDTSVVQMGQLSAAYQLAVLGDLNVTSSSGHAGSITAAGGISAGASSTFTGGVTVVSGGQTISAGNLTFGTTGQRIIGDLSNGTVANRLLVQTSTSNNQTVLGVIPNGSSVIAGLTAYNNQTPSAATSIGFLTTSTQMRLAVEDAGGGYLPLVIRNGGAIRAQLESNGSLSLVTGPGDFGGGTGVIYIGNRASAPSSNPSGGGILYAASGAGTWRGSSGTTTTFGPADPHCPDCGRDFAWEWKNDQTGHLAICAWCFTEGAQRGIIRREAGEG